MILHKTKPKFENLFLEEVLIFLESLQYDNKFCVTNRKMLTKMAHNIENDIEDKDITVPHIKIMMRDYFGGVNVISDVDKFLIGAIKILKNHYNLKPEFTYIGNESIKYWFLTDQSYKSIEKYKVKNGKIYYKILDSDDNLGIYTYNGSWRQKIDYFGVKVVNNYYLDDLQLAISAIDVVYYIMIINQFSFYSDILGYIKNFLVDDIKKLEGIKFI